MSENAKKVSKKKIIFVQMDEEITAIFERISKLSYSEIYLVVPRRAVLLQSIVNLKILKQKMDTLGKSLAIITNDPSGMKLAYQAEVKVFDHWDIDEEKKKGEEKENRTEDGKEEGSSFMRPIPATQNDIEDDSPSRLPKKKSSIFEVVRNVKQKDKGFSLRSYIADIKKHRLEKEPLNFYLTPGKKRFLAGFLMVSAVMFFIILYVALPGATIYIEPSTDVIGKGTNVILVENPSAPRELQLYNVSAETDLTISHSATTVESMGNNASGKITIINISGINKPLIENTRFQTADGIVFRINEGVTVPSGTMENPGKLEVTVMADPVDANGVAVGDRGNIGPTKFILPALREESRKELYAESYAPMTGGTTSVIVKVSEEDLMAARTRLESDLKEKALAALRKETLSTGNGKGLSLRLIEDEDTLIFGTAKIDVPYELIGQEKESFELSGTISVSGVAYDSDALYSILKEEIIASETPGKNLISIDENSISLNVLEANQIAQTYKVTAQIQGVEEYQIDPSTEDGAALADKVKEHVAGKTVADAESYIQNLPEVNSVQIKLWPMWSPNIPNLVDNIKIKSLAQNEEIQ
ncbi:MAG: hypothetical protein WC846_01425 [Candidatus Gracilibacteria bacterium]|jgi:hypothetical protein